MTKQEQWNINFLRHFSTHSTSQLRVSNKIKTHSIAYRDKTTCLFEPFSCKSLFSAYTPVLYKHCIPCRMFFKFKIYCHINCMRCNKIVFKIDILSHITLLILQSFDGQRLQLCALHKKIIIAKWGNKNKGLSESLRMRVKKFFLFIRQQRCI